MTILDEAQATLEQAGYRTAVKFEPTKSLYFEDWSILGFVAVFPSVPDLLGEWSKVQDAFLSQNASRFRLDREKAWNIYSVLLAEGTGSEEELRRLRALEEDFTATRKLTEAGVSRKAGVKKALTPLLPLARLPDEESAEQALREKLTEKELSFLDQILSSTHDAEEVSRWLTTR